MGLKEMRLAPEKIEKVFVIGLSCLGDMLLSSAALWNLRLFLPKAHFCLWVGPRAVAAVEKDPLWDVVQVYDRHRDYPGILGRLEVIRKIRSYGPDLIIDLRSGLNPLFSGAKYAPLWGVREIMLSHDMHEAERNLVAMASLGVPVKVRHLRFFIPEVERHEVCRQFKLMGGGNSLMVVNPGAGEAERRWETDRFKALALDLGRRYGAVVGVMGHTPEERGNARRILEALGPYGLDLTSCGSLGQLAAILEKADLFVTNDTGPLHLASALSVPTVGIFLKNNLNRFGPWGNPHRTVCPRDDSSPVPLAGSSKENRGALDTLSVEEVRNACDELLRELAASGRFRGGWVQTA